MHTPRGDLDSDGGFSADPWDSTEPVVTYQPVPSQVTGLTDHQADRLRTLETEQAALHATVAKLDGAVATMAEDHKALRRQCDNLETGIHTISGAQTTLSHDLRGFMQQMGPLLSLAQQQAANSPTGSGHPATADTPPSAPTPALASPTGVPPAGGGGTSEATATGDGGFPFAPVRQPPTIHSGPYSPC